MVYSLESWTTLGICMRKNQTEANNYQISDEVEHAVAAMPLLLTCTEPSPKHTMARHPSVKTSCPQI